jgi:hypothetical protein
MGTAANSISAAMLNWPPFVLHRFLPFKCSTAPLQQAFSPRRKRNKIRNPNIEIRNKPKDLNPNYEIRNRLVWNFLILDHLKLFRISDFEFRICNLVHTWRTLRRGSGHALRFCASDIFSDSVLQKPSENFKYLELGFIAEVVSSK